MTLLTLTDRTARASLVIGLMFMLIPGWAGGFRLGFFILLAGTLVHLVTARMVAGK